MTIRLPFGHELIIRKRLPGWTRIEMGLALRARQDKAFRDQVRVIKNALAARKALRSGEAEHQLREAQLQRDKAAFDTTEEPIQFIRGLQKGLEAREQYAAGFASAFKKQADKSAAELNARYRPKKRWWRFW